MLLDPIEKAAFRLAKKTADNIRQGKIDKWEVAQTSALIRPLRDVCNQEDVDLIDRTLFGKLVEG